MSATRRALQPPPPDPIVEWSPPPPGYRAVWEVDDASRMATLAESRHRRCRGSLRCPHHPVAALVRPHVNGSLWWLYCRHHLYGRRIVGGVVLVRRLRRVES